MKKIIINQKWLIIGAIILILLLGLGYYFGNKYLLNKQSQAYSQAVADISIAQTQSGNILLISNNQVQTIPIAQICQNTQNIQEG